MPNEIISAIIAALISIVVAYVSYKTNRRIIQSEREKHEREMQRRLTEKLYDLRLQNYPEAFEISDRLRGELIFKDPLVHKEFPAIRAALFEWQRTKGAFVLSEKSIGAYKRLQEALKKWPRSDSQPAEEELKKIWEAKNHFRRCLRADVNLIYSEEERISK